jgi:hypothetical protein
MDYGCWQDAESCSAYAEEMRAIEVCDAKDITECGGCLAAHKLCGWSDGKCFMAANAWMGGIVRSADECLTAAKPVHEPELVEQDPVLDRELVFEPSTAPASSKEDAEPAAPTPSISYCRTKEKWSADKHEFCCTTYGTVPC